MDVIFEPSTGGNPFSIEVGFFDSVLEIKEKIQKYQGIPIPKQTLIFHGHVLPDDSDVSSCQLFQFSRVRLLIAATAASSFDHHHLERPAMTTVMSPPPPHQAFTSTNNKEKLHSGGAQELNGQYKTIGDCELSQHQFEIDVAAVMRPSPSPSPSPSLPPPQQHPIPIMTASGGSNSNNSKRMTTTMKVMVQNRSGNRRVAVEVNAADNVGELRKELNRLMQHQEQQEEEKEEKEKEKEGNNNNESFHLPAEGYFFIYKQMVMDDDRSFRWHHVSPGDTIEIFNGHVTAGS